MSTDGSGDLYAGRIPLGERTLRQHTARGTVVNAGFLTALSFLGLLKAFLVAAFLTPDDYGIWGILLAGIVTISFLSELGVGDKYIQQTESDPAQLEERLDRLWGERTGRPASRTSAYGLRSAYVRSPGRTITLCVRDRSPSFAPALETPSPIVPISAE